MVTSNPTNRSSIYIQVASGTLRFKLYRFLFANCKCKLDTCTVELSESQTDEKAERTFHSGKGAFDQILY